MTQPIPTPGLDAGARTLVEGNTAFALDLYQQLRQEEGNLFFSPYSISTALAMTYAGARGVTEAQMADALHLLLPQDALHPAFAKLEALLRDIQASGDVQLSVANALCPHIEYCFLDSFLDLVKVNYGVSLTAVDYRDPEAARQQINAWVEQKTNDKIQNLIPLGTIKTLTRLVLTNAIFFKGNWASQFDKGRTRDADFALLSGKHVAVPMMAQKLECGYGETDDLQILELPYVGDALSMIVLLPRTVDGVAALEARLTPDTLERWTKRLRETKVEVFLPRFKLSAAFRLDEVLKAMGMIDAFELFRADFSGLDGADMLFISAVLHKAFVDVNEEGTEAAAATAVVMEFKGPPPPAPVFRADHPFIFLIRENSTGSLLFLGRVLDPAAPET